MFGIIADLVASVTTILLPAWLACKAVRSSDPAQLTPWLIYFILLALVLLTESWTLFIIGWFPFYSWIRLGVLLWMALPQTQGAIYLYQSHLAPFVVQHERQIDEFIGYLHNSLQSIGLGYLSQLVDFLREKALGQAAPQSAGAAQDTSAAGYAQSLMSRFAMPDARTNAQNLYGMLSSLSVPAGIPSRARGVSPASAQPYSSAATAVVGFNMPSGSALEKSNYIASERARLANMLRSLEREQQSIDLAYGTSSSSSSDNGTSTPLAKSRSEVSFESISHSDVLPIPPSLVPGVQSQSQKPNTGTRRTVSRSGSGWMGSWFAGATPSAEELSSRPATGRSVSGQSTSSGRGWSAAKEVTDAIQGMSSSVDTGDDDGNVLPDRRY